MKILQDSHKLIKYIDLNVDVNSVDEPLTFTCSTSAFVSELDMLSSQLSVCNIRGTDATDCKEVSDQLVAVMLAASSIVNSNMDWGGFLVGMGNFSSGYKYFRNYINSFSSATTFHMTEVEMVPYSINMQCSECDGTYVALTYSEARYIEIDGETMITHKCNSCGVRCMFNAIYPQIAYKPKHPPQPDVKGTVTIS